MPPKAFVSFSGGKDSHLSLWKAKAAGFDVVALLSMVREDGSYSASHRIPVEILRRQSEALRIPIVVCPTSWEEYEDNFIACLEDFREKGVTFGVFGDIDLPEHREWVERVCAQVGITPFLPLWGKDHHEVALEVVQVGFEAYVTVVRDGVLPPEFLGRRFDRVLLEEFAKLGIDPCGERGEFHTLVVSGPLYQNPIPYTFGEIAFDGKCHYLVVS
ncbi:MAG: diphthine--ammonia ligase [Candidatus Caldatribacterium sp.]|nr:diphthine--ammonia ligase [Candidatus Caldatribacterium sp.]